MDSVYSDLLAVCIPDLSSFFITGHHHGATGGTSWDLDPRGLEDAVRPFAWAPWADKGDPISPFAHGLWLGPFPASMDDLLE